MHLLVSHSGVLLSIVSFAFPIQIIFPIFKNHWINNLLWRYQWVWYLGLCFKAYKFPKHPISTIWKCSSQSFFWLYTYHLKVISYLQYNCDVNVFSVTIISHFFWRGVRHHAACRILAPWPGTEPGPQQWKPRILTTSYQWTPC